MTILTLASPHPTLGKFAGQICNVTVDGKTWFNKKVHFIGTNGVGQDVVSFEEGGRSIFYIDNWNNVKIELCK